MILTFRRTGRQVVTNEHLRNIQKAFSEYSQTDANQGIQAQEFPQYLAINDSHQPTIMGEVFNDTAYLEQNPNLNNETKLKFIKRVANRAIDLNIFGAYGIVISTLDDYLRSLLRLDFNISE